MVVISHLTETLSAPAEELSPDGFSNYGGVISPEEQLSTVKQSQANQGTAIKMHKVCPIINAYDQAPSGITSAANFNIFRCSPPMHLISKSAKGWQYNSKVLERHPFSTQTFIPMGKESSQAYLVIVALPKQDGQKLPDLSTLKAFVCRGNQAVTYGIGIWHAPMIALGEKKEDFIDFSVLIHENGVDNEDCEEVVFDEGLKIDF